MIFCPELSRPAEGGAVQLRVVVELDALNKYIYIYIYIYTYIYIYIYIYILSSSQKPSGRFLMVSVVDIIQRFVLWFPSLFCLRFPSRQETLFMVSVVVFSWFPSRRENIFLWFPFLRQQARAEARRGWDATDSPQTHDCAGDAQARSDSGTVMRSPAAKDPDLTSGLRGFNPGGARVVKVIAFACFLLACCLLVACLLLACCLLVACLLLAFACFCLFFFVFVVSFSSREAKLRSRAERHRYVSCFRYVSGALPLRFRYVSATFPLRFRYVSVVRLPVAPARGKCKGSLRQRAIIKETSVGAW